jgi:hypothetical protein
MARHSDYLAATTGPIPSVITIPCWFAVPRTVSRSKDGATCVGRTPDILIRTGFTAVENNVTSWVNADITNLWLPLDWAKQ